MFAFGTVGAPRHTTTIVTGHTVRVQSEEEQGQMRRYCFFHWPLKLVVIKQFVTSLDKEFAAFKYLQNIFPKLSAAEFKGGVFAKQ